MKSFACILQKLCSFWYFADFPGFSEKNRVISPFSASDVLSYKICLGQDELMNFGMETKEGLLITAILISYPEVSGKTSYKGFKKVRYLTPPHKCIMLVKKINA